MKSWLKSLFGGNSLKELDEEIEEQQSNPSFYQPSSIENKKKDEMDRPNFRFPLQLDEEIPHKQEDEKVEPVFHQQKNYDFWQEPKQQEPRVFTIEKQPETRYREERQPSNQRYDTYYQAEQKPVIEKVVKEEKVDIVFRPKRKTPFRPSEYISPIYGYQKPVNNTEAQQSVTVEDKPTEIDGLISLNEKTNTSLSIDSSVELEQEVVANNNLIDQKSTEITDFVAGNQLDKMEEENETEVQDSLSINAVKNPIENRMLIEGSEVANQEVTKVLETTNELIKDKTEDAKNDFVESLQSSEIDFEEKNEKEETEIDHVEAKHDEELISEEQLVDEENEIENMIDVIENEGVIVNHNELHQQEIVEDNQLDDVNHNPNVMDEDVEIENHNVEILIHEESNSNNEINNEQLDELVKSEESASNLSSNETTEDKSSEKVREKKRHFPFNVMMLRSDVEAARKANIMRQLQELQRIENSSQTEELTDDSDSIPENIQENLETTESNKFAAIEGDSPVSTHVNEGIEEEHFSNEEQLNELTEEEIETKTNHLEQETKTEPELEPEQEPELELALEPETEPEMPPVLYELPDIELLAEPPIEDVNDGDWVEEQKVLLQETLQNFNVGAKVIAATQGPTVTRFEVQPDPGVKVNKITNLQDDIKLSLAARDIRIEAPIPGRSAIGIEVPNRESKPVYLSELVSNEKFLQSESPLTVALGLDIGGEPVYADIAKMPHGLIAGATGSGKSVCINSILVSILFKAKPHEVRLILIDPKMVELAPYNHIPHLISPVITDARAATAALKWACDEMDRRYDLFAHAGARDIKRYNDIARKKGAFNDVLPYLVIVIDELADLMMVSPGDVETYICRIAQKARACGIHLLVATQRPSVDVITGIIKSNIPTRIAFTVSSQVDSRTIIDIGGAEKLLGRGDMLFLDNGKSQAIRLQGVYVSDDEIEHVVEIVKDQQKPNYLFNQEQLVAKADSQDVDDELFDEAVEFVIDQKGASVSLLQRRFRIGYNRAARLIDLMFDHGIVSNQNGSKPRDVLITLEQFQSKDESL